MVSCRVASPDVALLRDRVGVLALGGDEFVVGRSHAGAKAHLGELGRAAVGFAPLLADASTG